MPNKPEPFPARPAVFREVLDAMGRMREGAHTIEAIQARVPQFTRIQVSSALSNHVGNHRRSGTIPAVIHVNEGVYRLNDNGSAATPADPTKRHKIPQQRQAPKESDMGDTLFEYVGTFGGNKMVRGDTSGELYILTEG